MPKKESNNTTAVLRSLRDRIVTLEEEKKALSSDIKEVYAEAKSQGFDVKALRRIVKDSMMDQTGRAAQRETETIVDLYRASLGMLDGAPLGDAARQRFEEDAQDAREARADKTARGAKRSDDSPSQDPAAPPDDETAHSDGVPPSAGTSQASERSETLEEAHERGRSDHAAGRSVLQNPYPASSPLRAAWDEGWCEASGSDGMDVPDAWRRRAPPEQPAEA